jgi:hypothetical protein
MAKDLATQAAELAAHLREHFFIEGEPRAASGGPTPTSCAMLIGLWDKLRRTLEPRPEVETAAGKVQVDQLDAINRLRLAVVEIGRHYGFDPLETHPNPTKPLDSDAIRMLEWSANKLQATKQNRTPYKAEDDTVSCNSVPSAKMSPKELAEKYGVDGGCLRKRLDRWRYDHDTGYIEVSNAAKNEPKYLYDEAAVMPVIENLKDKSVGRKRAANVLQKNI